jgi:hypothetical protein
LRLRRLLSTLVDAPFSHPAKCERKLHRLVAERRSRLEKRGLTREDARKQAMNELVQFVEQSNLDTDWIPDIAIAEDNFHLFTKSLDSKSGETRR